MIRRDGITKLSQLEIDADKDWDTKKRRVLVLQIAETMLRGMIALRRITLLHMNLLGLIQWRLMQLPQQVA